MVPENPAPMTAIGRLPAVAAAGSAVSGNRGMDIMASTVSDAAGSVSGMREWIRMSGAGICAVPNGHRYPSSLAGYFIAQ